MKNSLPLPKEAAIAREVHAHRAVLKERVASTLAELAVVPQAKIRASFHLVYFCEQLGLTSAQDSGELFLASIACV